MAILATLIGGIAGLISFACAVIVYDMSVLCALGVYVAVGTCLTLGLIAVALFWRSCLKITATFRASVRAIATKKTVW